MKQTFASKLLFGLMLALPALPVAAQAQQPTAPQKAVAQASVNTCLTCHGSDPKVTAIGFFRMAVTLGSEP